MIQRKQSLYILLIVITIIFTWVLNINISSYSVVKEGLNTDIRLGFLKVEMTNVSLEVDGREVVKPEKTVFFNRALITLMSISVLLSLVTLLLFKNLKLQKTFLTVHYLIIALIFYYVYYTHAELVKEFPGSASSGFAWTVAIILLIPVFNMLAINSIRKDIELLASVDRLR